MKTSDNYTMTFEEMVNRFPSTREGETNYWARAWGIFTQPGINKVELISQLNGLLHSLYISYEDVTRAPFHKPLNDAMLECLLTDISNAEQKLGYKPNPTIIAAHLVDLAKNTLGFTL